MKKLPLYSAVLLLAAPFAALAHAHLESSTPAKGSTVKASPASVMLMFAEAVELTAMSIQKSGDKTATPLAPLPKQASVHLMVPLPKLADGDYTITYSYVSDDQHEMKGSIPFRVSAKAK